MKRTATALTLVGMLLLACTSDGPESESTVEVSASLEASPASEPTSSTPAWVRPEPTLGPEWEPHDLFEGETGLVWESFVPEPGDSGGWGQHGSRLYDRERDEFWRLRGPDGEAYFLALSPTEDLALAGVIDPDTHRDAPSVLVDLATGEMRGLTPFPLNGFDSWDGAAGLDAGVIQTQTPRWPEWDGRRWPAGQYEIDLAAGEIQMLRLAQGAYPVLRTVPVPPGSVFEAEAAFARRILPDLGQVQLVLLTPDGTEEVLVDRVAGLHWSPDKHLLLLREIEDDREPLVLFDPMTGATRKLDGDNRYGHPSWSPDGRFLAVDTEGTVLFYDTTDPADPLLPFLGPIEDSRFADWGPAAAGDVPSEALLLGNYCAPEDGFRLDRIDLATGEVRRLPTEVGGFWVSDWSPSGD